MGLRGKEYGTSMILSIIKNKNKELAEERR